MNDLFSWICHGSAAIRRRTGRGFILSIALGLTFRAPVSAQVEAVGGRGHLHSISKADERLTPPPPPVTVPLETEGVSREVRETWQHFISGAGGRWQAYVDRRSGRIDIAEGKGAPWIPGRGNTLTTADLARSGERGSVDLALLERLARKFLEPLAPVLGVDPRSIVLDRGRSGHPADYLWNVDFNVLRGDVPIEGGRVVFRVNNGNLVQFGTENLPSPDIRAPQARLSREQARARLSDLIGGDTAGDRFVDPGSLRLLPAAPDRGRNVSFAIGAGRQLVSVWQFVFLRSDEEGTWLARVDAVTGSVLELYDINDYAQVTGGVFPISASLGGETALPMPFADVSSGLFTNSAGLYTFSGVATTSTLNGQYVKVVDNCGTISQSSDSGGLIPFGVSAGTDCTTPGSGGAGNTHSARTQFYHVNRAKEAGRGFLTGNAWLGAQLQVNVNINLTCNAFWSPGTGTLNFYRSGGGCGNTGEIAGVSLHEYGHGLDSNDGNLTSANKGTGETYGDFTASLGTHTSCIGPGFRTTNCVGYGDTCTACTGVRDIDWAQHTSAAAHTVANFTQPLCPANSSYTGPCGREGHCESYVSSEALWDLAARDLPSPGTGSAWSIVDRLWYLSRPTATTGFVCDTTGATWTSNGCATGAYWRALRAVDDDDGDLTNGTPHSCALYAAFNRHGLACTTDPGANICFSGCTPPAVPTITLTPGLNQVTVNWTNSGTSVVYDVYRSEVSCNAALARVANDVAGTSYVDTAVSNRRTYFYQVVAQPSGNEACAAAPSVCVSTVPGVDVWSQDRPNDTGLEPDPATAGQPMWESDDIWVRTDATNGPHQNPELGQTNFVHVRVRNRGMVAAGPFNAEVYVAAASTGLAWPGQWTLVGTAPVTALSGGTDTEVLLNWTPTGTGHYCLVSRLVSTEDPMTYAETTSIGFNVLNNNNVVWKNVEVVDLNPLQSFTAELLVPNPRPDGRRFRLLFEEVRPRNVPKPPALPRVARIEVAVGRPVHLEKAGYSVAEGTRLERTAGRVVPVTDLQKATILLSLQKGEVVPLKLTFRRVARQPGRPQDAMVYLLRVVQLDVATGERVGGMTYQIRVPRM